MDYSVQFRCMNHTGGGQMRLMLGILGIVILVIADHSWNRGHFTSAAMQNADYYVRWFGR